MRRTLLIKRHFAFLLLGISTFASTTTNAQDVPSTTEMPPPAPTTPEPSAQVAAPETPTPVVATPPPTTPLPTQNVAPTTTPPPPAVTPVVATPTAPHTKFPTRSLRIGPSVQIQLYEPFPYEKLSRIGTGMFGAYEFYLKPSFAIGINLSYRYHPGKADMHQVGYGLLLKHYLAGTKSPDSIFMPFVEYGLLLQMIFLSNRKGFGTAHDTRLSAGTDIRINKQIFFVEGSWHYSRLGLFNQKSERLDDLEFDVGYRYPW